MDSDAMPLCKKCKPPKLKGKEQLLFRRRVAKGQAPWPPLQVTVLLEVAQCSLALTFGKRPPLQPYLLLLPPLPQTHRMTRRGNSKKTFSAPWQPPCRTPSQNQQPHQPLPYTARLPTTCLRQTPKTLHPSPTVWAPPPSHRSAARAFRGLASYLLLRSLGAAVVPSRTGKVLFPIPPLMITALTNLRRCPPLLMCLPRWPRR